MEFRDRRTRRVWVTPIHQGACPGYCPPQRKTAGDTQQRPTQRETQELEQQVPTKWVNLPFLPTMRRRASHFHTRTSCPQGPPQGPLGKTPPSSPSLRVEESRNTPPAEELAPSSPCSELQLPPGTASHHLWRPHQSPVSWTEDKGQRGSMKSQECHNAGAHREPAPQPRASGHSGWWPTAWERLCVLPHTKPSVLQLEHVPRQARRQGPE